MKNIEIKWIQFKNIFKYIEKNQDISTFSYNFNSTLNISKARYVKLNLKKISDMEVKFYKK